MTEKILSKLDDFKNVLQNNVVSKKNKDMGREYSFLIEELESRMKHQAKTKSLEIYYEENPLVFEQPKKQFKNSAYYKLN